MGNSMTVVKVYIRDEISYYKPPVRVMEILTEHPDYVLVSMCRGKRIILSSDVSLRPARNYYLVSPDNLFSDAANSQIPSDQTLRCSSRLQDKVCFALTIYASVRSLLAMLIQKRKRLKIKSLVTIWNFRCADQPGRSRRRKRTNRVDKDNCAAGANAMAPLQAPDAPAPAPASALIRALSETSEWSRSQNEMTEVWSPSLNQSESSSPQFLPVGHVMVAKVEERSLSRTLSSTFTANSGAELEKVSSSCIPWKSSKSLELESGGTISQTAFSKEKWLEDMIRGADNQWKRNKPQAQRSTMEGAESNEIQLCFEPKLWGRCLPSVGPLPKNELYADYSECLTTPGSSPGSMSFDIAPVHHNQQPYRHEDHQNDYQVGRSARLHSETVGSKQTLKLDKRDVGDQSQHPLWVNMDEIDRQFQRCLPSSASPPTAQISLQKYPRKDATAKPGSPKFSRVDRG